MVTIAIVCQSELQLILLLDGLCNGAKTISVHLKVIKFSFLSGRNHPPGFTNS